MRTLDPHTPATDRRRSCWRDRSFREGFAVLGRLGLSFDAWLYHPQIDELADLARAFPDTSIVLDHVGGPLGIGAYRGRRDEMFPGWAASIRALAAHPNVCVKIGGLGMRINGFGFDEQRRAAIVREAGRGLASLRRDLHRSVRPPRCMFESNFPVDKGSYSYPVFWNACKLMAKGASDAEKADLFAGTAARFYRLTAE